MKDQNTVERLLRPEIAEMEEYTPIVPLEVLSRRLGIPADRIVKLDANENPYGPLPAVAEALAEYSYYHIYPDPEQREHFLPARRSEALDDGNKPKRCQDEEKREKFGEEEERERGERAEQWLRKHVVGGACSDHDDERSPPHCLLRERLFSP